jgi:hypothetical protein
MAIVRGVTYIALLQVHLFLKQATAESEGEASLQCFAYRATEEGRSMQRQPNVPEEAFQSFIVIMIIIIIACPTDQNRYASCCQCRHKKACSKS